MLCSWRGKISKISSSLCEYKSVDYVKTNISTHFLSWSFEYLVTRTFLSHFINNPSKRLHFLTHWLNYFTISRENFFGKFSQLIFFLTLTSVLFLSFFFQLKILFRSMSKFFSENFKLLIIWEHHLWEGIEVEFWPTRTKRWNCLNLFLMISCCR